ncbi:uncharacterized protein EI90DRAFT_3050872 [Cantharellus anzutake]|uniref:uncharacterized protein n=1 Tax=Cantharellus anzutake TaxID=1750568 RepID=UPI001902C72C|nr:uncharacterized protein EI90DRAFT_3050872 [Cantharellus anzutake]KAF8334066.1 hypothetical protein EI90DRAFT_3050872 [Cantharellus anzutake]
MAYRFANATSLPVCVPNYRLSPAVKHPTHTNDVQAALNHLLSKAHDLRQGSFYSSPDAGRQPPPTATARHIRFTSLHLIGHSAGAHILGSLFLSPPPLADGVSPPSPCYACSISTLPWRKNPSPSLVRHVRSIICLAGVYNLDLLLRSFPQESCRLMMIDGFGDRDHYVDVDLTTYNRLSSSSSLLVPEECKRVIDNGIRWVIVHSQGDSLVDMLQPEAFYKRLMELYPNPNSKESRAEVAYAAKNHNDGKAKDGSSRNSTVLLDVTTLTEEHSALLETEQLAGLVKDIVLDGR